MLKHIVLWKLKGEAEGKSKEENMEIMRDRLLMLRKLIPELKEMEVGIDITHSDASYDMALITVFEDKAGLDVYAVHPEHLKVRTYIRKVIESRVTLDFEMD